MKAALVSLATDALPGVMVTWGVPRGTKDREWVLVGKVTGDQSSAAIGRARREEVYTVEIQVTVVRPDTISPQETAERAYTLVAAIETAIRTDETLGGVSGLIWARVEKTDLNEGLVLNADGQTTGERIAEVIVNVGCKSRI